MALSPTQFEHLMQPCIDCEMPTRPANLPLVALPNTVQRRASGRCVTCQRKEDRKHRRAGARPTCDWCGKELRLDAHGARRFCSTQCQQADWMVRKAPPPRPGRFS